MSWDEPVNRPKRRWVGMTVALAVFIGLVVATLVIGEKIGRDFAADLVQDQIGGALGLESDEGVTVDLGTGSLLAQAVTGGLDGVRVTADAVPVGTATADVVLTATGVPLTPGGSIATLSGTVALDMAALKSLSAGFSDAPITAVEQAEGDLLRLTTTTSVLGQEVPASVDVAPSVLEGAVAFTVVAMLVNNQPVDVAAAQAGTYGPAAASAATPRSLCVAEFMPSALTLTDATLAGDTLLLGFSGSDIAMSGGGLGSRGECA